MKLTKNDKYFRIPVGTGLFLFGIGLYVMDRFYPPASGCSGITAEGWSIPFPIIVGLIGIIIIVMGPRLGDMIRNRFGGKQ